MQIWANQIEFNFLLSFEQRLHAHVQYIQNPPSPSCLYRSIARKGGEKCKSCFLAEEACDADHVSIFKFRTMYRVDEEKKLMRYKLD